MLRDHRKKRILKGAAYVAVVDDAADQLGSQFHVASKGRCKTLERFGAFPKDSPARLDVKDQAILTSKVRLHPPFPGKTA